LIPTFNITVAPDSMIKSCDRPPFSMSLRTK
jgi:hypothetical protein